MAGFVWLGTSLVRHRTIRRTGECALQSADCSSPDPSSSANHLIFVVLACQPGYMDGGGTVAQERLTTERHTQMALVYDEAIRALAQQQAALKRSSLERCHGLVRRVALNGVPGWTRIER